MSCGIYAIYGPHGYVYIGQSVQIPYRWAEHHVVLEAGNHTSYRWQAAFNQYGHGVFTHKVIEECARPQLLDRERYWMIEYARGGWKLYNTLVPDVVGLQREFDLPPHQINQHRVFNAPKRGDHVKLLSGKHQGCKARVKTVEGDLVTLTVREAGRRFIVPLTISEFISLTEAIR